MALNVYYGLRSKMCCIKMNNNVGIFNILYTIWVFRTSPSSRLKITAVAPREIQPAVNKYSDYL